MPRHRASERCARCDWRPACRCLPSWLGEEAWALPSRLDCLKEWRGMELATYLYRWRSIVPSLWNYGRGEVTLVKTTVELPDVLHRKLRVKAALENSSMN